MGTGKKQGQKRREQKAPVGVKGVEKRLAHE